jgi:hypothetical protein
MASFGIFGNSAFAFDLVSSVVAKRVPLRSIFTSGNSQMSLGARSEEYGDWKMTGIFFSARNCAQQAMDCSVRYRAAETTAPVTCRAASTELLHLLVEMTSNTLSRWYELMVQQTVDVKNSRDLFDCRSY